MNALICPVCLERASPPTYACDLAGHMVCGKCTQSISEICPVCRGPFSRRRNVAFDSLCSIMKATCKHECGLEDTVNNLMEHEEYCTEKPFSCPVCRESMDRTHDASCGVIEYTMQRSNLVLNLVLSLGRGAEAFCIIHRGSMTRVDASRVTAYERSGGESSSTVEGNAVPEVCE